MQLGVGGDEGVLFLQRKSCRAGSAGRGRLFWLGGISCLPHSLVKKQRNMEDNGFSLADALSGNNPNPNPNPNPNQQNQGWPFAPWGYQNPSAGPFGPGAPAPYPGAWPPPSQPGSFPGPTPSQPESFPGPTPGQPAVPQLPNPFGAPKGPTPQAGGCSIPLTIPYERSLEAGIVRSLLITIQGVVKAKPQRFNIDLRKKNDIAFHLNPRFDSRPRSIVRNTMINNNWGQEEKHTPKFPFEPGKAFKVQILCDENHFKVAVNNEHLIQYNHRIKELKEINTLYITGDISLTNVELTMA